MPKRVVFFLGTVFNKRDYARFGFDIIRARGYAVEAWDFSPVLRPDYFKSYIPADPIDFDGHRLFANHRHIVDTVSGLSNDDVVICLIGLDLDSAFIFELIGKKNIHYGICLLGLLPQVSSQQRIKEQLHRLLSNPAAFLVKIFSRLRLGALTWMGRFQHIASPDFMLIGGGAAKDDRRYSTLGTTKVVKAHALDYDRYLEDEKLAHLKEDQPAVNYALFLDCDVPFHPDYLHININPYCTEDKYYSELNKFFDSFELATGISIIIAAHPRADYVKRGNPYGNRKLVSGKTIFYTKHAKLILTHASTSLNFAILYKKPILFMDSLEYATSFRHSIRNAAAAIGQKTVIVSEEPAFRLDELTINEELYERYKHTYIKEPGTPDKMCWDIFCDYVDELK